MRARSHFSRPLRDSFFEYLISPWRDRNRVRILVWRETLARHRNSRLGNGWVVLNPIVLAVVLSITLGRLPGLSPRAIPYSLYCFMAMLCWTFFSGAIQKAGASLLSSKSLIDSIYFPRLLIPMAAIGSNLIDLLFSLPVLLVAIAIQHSEVSFRLLLLPVCFLALALSTLGISLILSLLVAYLRDLQSVIHWGLQALFFLSPVVYPARSLTGPLQSLIILNPLTGVLALFEWCVAPQSPFPTAEMGYLLFFSGFSVLLGAFLFYWNEHEIPEII